LTSEDFRELESQRVEDEFTEEEQEADQHKFLTPSSWLKVSA
jgi:hypothetical protein